MRIERTATAWVERGGWSYARTENDPRFAYHDRRFGVAEGLAVDERHIFIVMDNNHDYLAADPSESAPAPVRVSSPAVITARRRVT